MLETNDTLTSLNMARNGFETSSAESIARALVVNRAVVNLDISSNPFGPKGEGGGGDKGGGGGGG